MSTPQHTGPEQMLPAVPEPSLAERARALVASRHIASLAPQSRHLPGFPFASLMPYAADDRGRPLIFVSSMAVHTQNLNRDPRASLLVTEQISSGDPLGFARATRLGSVIQVAPEEARAVYLARHENAKYWQNFKDFAYYRLDVLAVYFIGGFGVMGWIAAEDYAHAQPAL